MKTQEAIGYGLLAFFGYQLLIKPRTTTVVQTPGVVTPSSGASLVNQVAPLAATTVGTLFNKLFPSSAPASTAPVQSTTPVATPVNVYQSNPQPVLPVDNSSTVSTNPVDTSNIYAGNGPGQYTSDTQYLQTLEEDQLYS